ncbi:RING-H2 finger ATL70-like [Olea europaea subsp. europaea]|uniref:RING-H2 finger ATL70-like n=1 Tax=Olea europaea subsp. europaea TaxID=158383 RepID=A0A8S0QW25_OLEEU|nr:RING-H2 finger ATL70-like [Olea europaea subsp. europaea]
MSTTLEAIESPENARGQAVGGFGYGLGLSLGILAIFVITIYASYMCTRGQGQGGATLNNHHFSTHQSSTTSTDDNSWHPSGLDETTISTYPQFLYSKLKSHKCESTASACSICLADYKDTDLLRLMPDCGHFFHLLCIDHWLKTVDKHQSNCPLSVIKRLK